MNASFDYYLKMVSDYKAEAKKKTSEEEENINLAKTIMEEQFNIKRNLPRLKKYEEIAETRKEKKNKVNDMYQDYLGFKMTRREDKCNVILITLSNVFPNNPDKKCTLQYNHECCEIVSCHPSLKNLNQLKIILTEENDWPKFMLTLRESWKALNDNKD